MDLGIKNKRVLVTGASQGVGKAMALAFAGEGCKVSIISRKEEESKKVIEEMGGSEQWHDYYVADLMEPGAPTRAVEELLRRNGNYDIVINNLGGTLEVRDPLSSIEDYTKVWKFNAGVAIEINNLLIPKMKEKGWGRIIHISSLAGNHVRGCAAYGPAKAYLNAYTKMIGKKFAKDGIVISALLPCSVYAKGGHWDEETYEGEEKEAFLKKKADFMKHYCPRKKFGVVEEITGFALFMASEQASLGSSCLIPIGATEELGF